VLGVRHVCADASGADAAPTVVGRQPEGFDANRLAIQDMDEKHDQKSRFRLLRS
jgi:hypothetical protein